MITKQLRVESYSPEGLQFNLGDARNLRVGKVFSGGEDMSCSFDLDRDPRVNYRDIAYGHDVILRRGLNEVWKGEMRSITQGKEMITVGCPGQWIYLDDKNHGDEQRLWCDNRYKKWIENDNSVPEVNTFNWTPEKYVLQSNYRLYMAPRRDEMFRGGALGSYAGFCYIADTPEIIMVSFDYDLDLAWTTNFTLTLYSVPPAGAWWTEWGPLTGTVSSGVKDITISNIAGVATHLIWYLACSVGPTRYIGETGEDVYVEITNLRVWGQNTEEPSVIHVVEDVVGEVEATTPIDNNVDDVLELMPVRDRFTDANGTLLVNHRPDKDEERGGWNIDIGGFDIQGNEANNTAANSRAYVDSGLSDCVIGVDCTTPAAGNYYIGIVFRLVDANNFWLYRLDFNGNITLGRMLAAAWSVRWTGAVGVERSFTYHPMVKLRGDNIDLYLGGILRHTEVDASHQTATRHGLASATVANMRWDNFEVFEAHPIWPLFYEEGESCYDAIKDAASFGDWDYRALGWGVETGGDRAFLRKANRENVRYVIPAQFCQQLSSRGETQRDFYSSGWARYYDERGVARFTDEYFVHVTNDGLEVDTTATGDDLASVVYGVHRDNVFDFGRVDAELAVEYLIKALQEQGHPQVQSSIAVYGPVKDLHRGGAWIEPIEMEMGYLVRIPWFRAGEAEGIAGSDLRDWDTTFLMVGLELDVTQGIARLIPEGAQEDLSRMIKAARSIVEEDEKRLKDKRSRPIGG